MKTRVSLKYPVNDCSTHFPPQQENFVSTIKGVLQIEIELLP